MDKRTNNDLQTTIKTIINRWFDQEPRSIVLETSMSTLTRNHDLSTGDEHVNHYTTDVFWFFLNGK